MFEKEGNRLHQCLVLRGRMQIKLLEKSKHDLAMGGVIPPDERLMPVAMMRTHLLAFCQERGGSSRTIQNVTHAFPHLSVVRGFGGGLQHVGKDANQVLGGG